MLASTPVTISAAGSKVVVRTYSSVWRKRRIQLPQVSYFQMIYLYNSLKPHLAGIKRPRLSNPRVTYHDTPECTIRRSHPITAPVNIVAPMNTIAGPSSEVIDLTVDHAIDDEIRILKSLGAGEGISEYEYKGLIEVCGKCGKYYMASILREHIPTCSSSFDNL